MQYSNNESRYVIEDIVSYNTARDLLNLAIYLYQSKLKKYELVTKNQFTTIDKLQ